MTTKDKSWKKRNIIISAVLFVVAVLIAYYLISSYNIKEYSKIYCRGTVTLTEYTLKDGNYVIKNWESNPFSNSTPYSEYLWENYHIDIHELLTFAGFPYNKVDTIYESCIDFECNGSYLIYVGDTLINLKLYSKVEKLTQDTNKIYNHLILTANDAKIDAKLIGYCIRK